MAYQSLEDAATNGWEIERQYLCQAHGDKSPSASLNSNGYYICFACGDKGRLDMSKVVLTPKTVQLSLERLSKKIDDRRTYSELWLDIFDSDGPGDYWLSRYDERTCKHYRLGHTVLRSTYPMRTNKGEVLGVVYRNPEGQNPKYLYPYSATVSDHLFDLHRIESKDMILTEGATDAMACYEVGINAAVASYRAGVSAAQVRLIEKYDPRVLWVAYDMDDAGEAGYQKVKNALPDVDVRRVKWIDYKDLASIPPIRREKVLRRVLI